MEPSQLIQNYLAGPLMLRETVAGMSNDDFNAAPIPGKWSTRQVICHLADCERVYADRMTRVIAEDEPTLFSLDPDTFASRLAYEGRNIETELRLIELTREQLGNVLKTLSPSDFQRNGRHSKDGPITLETLLQRITDHIPHHVKYIEEKRAALAK